ncbi:MAG: SynChlorMet cassette protein ScmD [Candidatus Electrothrix sp. AUS4]|nr:SynChlorMet cassette protein ScmD [Candidatus Electrothrix sp. AUS4]
MNNKPIANPMVVLREEFDDWAILFDPDTGKGFGLNPVSVVIWKCLDGKHMFEEILEELLDNCEDMPDDAEKYVQRFINELIDEGLAGYELQQEA